MSDIDTTQSPSSVFYGYFSKYTWRNEKNGNSFFRIVTKQELFFEQQYCKKEVKKNPITELIKRTAKYQRTELQLVVHHLKAHNSPLSIMPDIIQKIIFRKMQQRHGY